MTTTHQLRYEVKATRGRKILFRAFYENYDDSQDALDLITEEYTNSKIEFVDHSPFAR